MLLGRIPELEIIDSLVDDARSENGGALLMLGEPGIGKTSLLKAAVESVSGETTLLTRGLEAEANLPYAALGDLLAPILNLPGDLPADQVSAIESALAVGPASTANKDRFATFSAFLSLLIKAAAHKPLLLVVDDAQWLDAASAECLAYTCRRLNGTRMALLAAARQGSSGALVDCRAFDRVHVQGLTDPDAHRLLRQMAPDLTRDVLDRMVELSAANPLALEVLLGGLSESQRQGLAPIDRSRMTTEAILNAFKAKLLELDQQARSAVVVAAAAFDVDRAPILAACRDLGLRTDAPGAAEASGVVAIDDRQFRFSHPLARAAACELAPPPERRRAHEALAAHSDDDARAWHLAAATLGKDEQVARLLESASCRASARGAHSAAVDALQRAARFTDDAPERSRRLHLAAKSAALAGQFERSASCFESSAEVEDPVLRARGLHGSFLVRLSGGMALPADASLRLGRAADSMVDPDPELAAAMHADAALLAASTGQFPLGVSAAGNARAALPEDASATVQCQVRAIAGICLVLTGEAERARESFDRAGALLARLDSLSPRVGSIIFAFQGRLFCGQEQTWKGELERLVEMARENDTFGFLPSLHTLSADAAFRTGDWTTAETRTDAVELSEEYGQFGVLPVALLVRGRLRAARGATMAARTDLTRAAEIAGAGGGRLVENMAKAATGFLELGADQPLAAIEGLAQVEAFAEGSGLDDPVAVAWESDLAEAYVRAGRENDARVICDSLDRRAKKSGTALAGAYSLRCRALVCGEGFEDVFERALDRHDRAGSPFEAGRTLLLFGRRLHRADQRIESRKRLRQALAIFDDLGAKPWARQARAELKAAGAIKRYPYRDPDELTPQEIKVAREVASGATNKQVAATMFLSPKTIDFHLTRVYRKLDIHSRAELATLVAEGALDQPG